MLFAAVALDTLATRTTTTLFCHDFSVLIGTFYSIQCQIDQRDQRNWPAKWAVGDEVMPIIAPILLNLQRDKELDAKLRHNSPPPTKPCTTTSGTSFQAYRGLDFDVTAASRKEGG